MDRQIYDEIAHQENGHWWFVARRSITSFLLSRLKLPANAAILDAGCGAGGNLPLLAEFGNVHAFELDDASLVHAKARGIGQVEAGKLPDGIPFAGTQFDLITMFDVLEHIEDDNAALAALHARLKPGGVLFLNVPAFSFLFGPVDVLHHHYRRYSFNDLREKLQAAGFDVELINYWNCLLFPAAFAARMLEKIRKPKGLSMGAATPPDAINRALATTVSLERFVIPRMRLPFGLSLMVVARKR